jgi:hypothetical protein
LNLETWGLVSSLDFTEWDIIGVTSILNACNVFFSSIIGLSLLVLVWFVADPDVYGVVSIKNLNIGVVEVLLDESENFFHKHVSSSVWYVEETRLEIGWHTECWCWEVVLFTTKGSPETFIFFTFVKSLNASTVFSKLIEKVLAQIALLFAWSFTLPQVKVFTTGCGDDESILRVEVGSSNVILLHGLGSNSERRLDT